MFLSAKVTFFYVKHIVREFRVFYIWALLSKKYFTWVFLHVKEKLAKILNTTELFIRWFIIYHLFFYVMQIDRGFRVFEPVYLRNILHVKKKQAKLLWMQKIYK